MISEKKKKKWVSYRHVLEKLFRLESKQETRIQMNIIKSIGSKEGKLCFFISRSSCVKSHSFVLPRGSLLLLSWLLCQTVKDTVELHDRCGLITIITEPLPCARRFTHTAISAVAENNTFQEISQSAKLRIKKHI